MRGQVYSLKFVLDRPVDMDRRLQCSSTKSDACSQQIFLSLFPSSQNRSTLCKSDNRPLSDSLYIEGRLGLGLARSKRPTILLPQLQRLLLLQDLQSKEEVACRASLRCFGIVCRDYNKFEAKKRSLLASFIIDT